MEYAGISSYHLKDEFFSLVDDDGLMRNKENWQYRPHFFCFADKQNSQIYWAIPQSTKVEKYHRLYDAKVNKYGHCNTIRFGSFAGKENAFLIQNMFPIIERYIDHVHTVNGSPVVLQSGLRSDLIRTANQVLALHKRGIKLIFPDIDRIYCLMLQELNK